MATCPEHSGVCVAMESCKARLTAVENHQDDCGKNVVKFKLFNILISVLLIVFIGVFSMGLKLIDSVERVERKVERQNIEMVHVIDSVKDLKNKVP